MVWVEKANALVEILIWWRGKGFGSALWCFNSRSGWKVLTFADYFIFYAAQSTGISYLPDVSSWMRWRKCFGIVRDGLWPTTDLNQSTLGGCLHTYCLAEHASFRLSCDRFIQPSGLGRFGTQQDVWKSFCTVIDSLWSPNTWVSLPWEVPLHV